MHSVNNLVLINVKVVIIQLPCVTNAIVLYPLMADQNMLLLANSLEYEYNLFDRRRGYERLAT